MIRAGAAKTALVIFKNISILILTQYNNFDILCV